MHTEIDSVAFRDGSNSLKFTIKATGNNATGNNATGIKTWAMTTRGNLLAGTSESRAKSASSGGKSTR